MSTTDEAIGQNVAEARKAADMSQQELADAMREYGWPWAQSTVWNLERGKRPLRLAEAVDLAKVLKLSDPFGFAAGGKSLAVSLLTFQLEAAGKEFEAVVERIVRDQVHIALTASSLENAADVKRILDDLRSWTVVDMADDQFRALRARLHKENLDDPIVKSLLESWDTIETNRENGERFKDIVDG